jgi:hypothetical protein
VASLDLLVSIGLVPVSFALAGPAAALIGAKATLIGGGISAAGALLACLVLSARSRQSAGVARPDLRDALVPADW